MSFYFHVDDCTKLEYRMETVCLCEKLGQNRERNESIGFNMYYGIGWYDDDDDSINDGTHWQTVIQTKHIQAHYTLKVNFGSRYTPSPPLTSLPRPTELELWNIGHAEKKITV